MKSYKNLYPQVCSLGNVIAAARTAMQFNGYCNSLKNDMVRAKGLEPSQDCSH